MTELLSNWNFARILRLAMGAWITYSGFTGNQPMFIFLGLLFAAQAIMNIGCCGVGGCNVQEKPTEKSTSVDDVIYEEVGIKNKD